MCSSVYASDGIGVHVIVMLLYHYVVFEVFFI